MEALLDISDDSFQACEELTIYAPEGSYAENYITSKNIPCVSKGQRDNHLNLQVFPDDILNLWNYVTSTCDEDDIDGMIEEFSFDIEKINFHKLNELAAPELVNLFADMVYMILNGVGNGDFETMYSILSENIGVDSDVIDSVLNY